MNSAKSKKQTMSLEMKKKFLDAVEKGDKSKKEIARKFNIPPSTLSTTMMWLKEKLKPLFILCEILLKNVKILKKVCFALYSNYKILLKNQMIKN